MNGHLLSPVLPCKGTGAEQGHGLLGDSAGTSGDVSKVRNLYEQRKCSSLHSVWAMLFVQAV